MTRLDALRALVVKPPETDDDQKIGHVYVYPKPAETRTVTPLSPWVEWFRKQVSA